MGGHLAITEVVTAAKPILSRINIPSGIIESQHVFLSLYDTISEIQIQWHYIRIIQDSGAISLKVFKDWEWEMRLVSRVVYYRAYSLK